MAHNNGIISAPVRVYEDIASVLGSSSGDVWTLYNHSAVKMWSRYKPVNLSTTNTKVLDHPTNWHLGADGDFGIVSKSLRSYQDVEAVKDYVDGNLNGWTYKRDTRAARVLDFDGYDHSVQSPFGTLYIAMRFPQIGPGEANSMRVDGNPIPGGTTQLGLDDLKVWLYSGGTSPTVIGSFGNMYVGAIIYKQSGSSWVYNSCVITNSQIRDLNTPTLYPIGSLPAGTYRVYGALFSSTAMNVEAGKPAAGGTIVTVPHWSYAPLVVDSAYGFNITIDNFWGAYNDFEGYFTGACYREYHVHASSYSVIFSLQAQLVCNGTVLTTLDTYTDESVAAGGTWTRQQNFNWNNSWGMTEADFYDDHGVLRISGTYREVGKDTTPVAFSYEKRFAREFID